MTAIQGPLTAREIAVLERKKATSGLSEDDRTRVEADRLLATICGPYEKFHRLARLLDRH